MMMTSLETLKSSFALDIKLFDESVSRDIGTEGFAPCGFGSFTRIQTHFDLVQFRLAHDACQPEQEAVMVNSRIIDDLRVGDPCADARAEVKQMTPIGIVARETPGFQGKH